MKNYRKFIPVVLVALLILSWYKLMSDKLAIETEYKGYLNEARQYAEQGITKYAIENYEKALGIKDNVDLYVEIAEYYKKQEKYNEFLAWGERAMVSFPTDAKGYEVALEANYIKKDYVSCYDLFEIAEKRKVTSDYLQKIYKEIEYMYYIDYSSFDDVMVYSNNYCAVKDDGLWGYVDRFGRLRIACKYLEVGAYTQSNYTSVVNSENSVYFIDKSGSKVIVMNDDIKKAGLLVDDIIAVERTDGKYQYVNQDGLPVIALGKDQTPVTYDYVSTINLGIGAVKNGNEWSIIDSTGKVLSDKKYTDIKVDEKNIAYRNERLFVKTAKGYIMVDSKGKQIGKQVYDDAKIFADTTYTAVKKDDKWFFVDKDGKRKSDKTYEEARSYLNGLAAVKIDGKWGFVDENEKLVINNIYNGAKDFNEKGSAFVKIGDNWQLLKLYRLNREE